MNLGHSVNGFGSLNGAVGGWIPKQKNEKEIRLIKNLFKECCKARF